MWYRNRMSDYCHYNGCQEQSKIRGFCCSHYQRLRRLKQIPIRLPSTLLTRKLKKILYNIQDRCGGTPSVNKFQYYGGRGIRALLTIGDLISIWGRDGASQMRCPSIDRINIDGDYTKENCRFVEFDENRRHRRKPRPNRECALCRGAFLGTNPSAKYCRQCRDKLKHPIKICIVCKGEFRSDRHHYVRCQNCQSETRPCNYCSKPITRSWAKDFRSMQSLH